MIVNRRDTLPVQGKKNFFKAHSKLLIITGTVLVVLGATGGYVLWSKAAWGSYEARYVDWKGSFGAKLNDTLALRSDTDQERSDKLQSLKQVSSDLNVVQGGLCKPESLVAWQQQFVATTKEDVAACEALATKASSFKVALDKAVEYIENENSVAQKLRNLPISDKAIEEKDWEGQVAAWRTANQELKDMSASEAFGPTRQKALESTEAVIKAWDEVIAASKEKNKQRYTKAGEALTTAHDTLDGVLEVNTQQIKPLTEALESAYRGITQ